MSKTIKNIVQVMLSNISTIISGVLVGFLLPKIISVESYGLYKTFTLSTSYLGLFSFGIIDGIVLKYGERNYDQLDKRKFRSYFKWYCLVLSIFAVIMCIMTMFMHDIEYRFIMIALVIQMVSVNITEYFQQISQITMRFHELATRKVLQSTLNAVAILMLYVAFKFGKVITYHYYLVLWLLFNVLLTIWYVNTYKDIVFSEALPLRETSGDIRQLISMGFPLLFANLCSMLILALDRQFVNILFDTTTYAIYAFAYNMLMLVTVATSAISTVLYPVLKRTDSSNLKKNYDMLVSLMMCFVFAAMIIYFPLSLFIKAFLPKYIDSIVIFRVIFPGLAISSTVTVIMHNYYKVFGDNMAFFKKSIVVLIASGVANYFAYALFATTISISAASILTMVFWYIYVEQYFVKKCGYRRGKNLIYMIFMSAVFYGVTFGLHEIEGGVIYCSLFVIVTVIFYKDKMSAIKAMIINKE